MCPTSSLVSCLVYCVSSHDLSRVSSFVSKSCESPKIVDNSDAMVAKIGMKINAIIAHNHFQGAQKNHLKSLPGASWASRGAQGAPRDHLERSRHAPGSSRDRPGSIPGAPGESPRAGPSVRKSARERPGALRGDQNRRRGASGSQKSEFFACAALTERLFDDFCRF